MGNAGSIQGISGTGLRAFRAYQVLVPGQLRANKSQRQRGAEARRQGGEEGKREEANTCMYLCYVNTYGLYLGIELSPVHCPLPTAASPPRPRGAVTIYVYSTSSYMSISVSISYS